MRPLKGAPYIIEMLTNFFGTSVPGQHADVILSNGSPMGLIGDTKQGIPIARSFGMGAGAKVYTYMNYVQDPERRKYVDAHARSRPG